MKENGECEEDFDIVFHAYLTNPRGFAFDLLAMLPLDIFALAASSENRLTLLSKLRVMHLLRLPRVMQFFARWENELQAKYVNCKLNIRSNIIGKISYYVTPDKYKCFHSKHT